MRFANTVPSFRRARAFQFGFERLTTRRAGAPTGSGKTTIFELAMLAALRGPNATESVVGGLNRRKVIYLAPNRALVAEKARDWRARFGQIGITFAELTGDQDFGGDIWGEIENVDVILATPEKFDRVTRLDANRGGMSFFSDVAAVLIDEVHLIGDSRGGCLEVIVSRLKLLSKSAALLHSHLRSVRFGAVSATIPNITMQNLASWLGAELDGMFVFGEEYRPVKLQTYVRTFSDGTNDFLFAKFLKNHVYGVILQFYRGKQTLVFSGSRDNALQTAKQLVLTSRENGNMFLHPQCARLLQEASTRAKNKSLADCIVSGVAFHHAGLEKEDRELAETLFRERLLIVLCSTSTLAVGVNLPAYLCVVAGTEIYDGGGAYKEISNDNLLQMIGRAGRPQYDTEGVAVVMTKNSLKTRYEGLVHGKYPLESSLRTSLPESLNAEISCRTVNSFNDALEWLQSTYYFIRMSSEPKKYGVQHGESAHDASKRTISATLRELCTTGMCAHANNSIQPLKAGDIMSLRYLRFKTMQDIMRCVSTSSFAELLRLLCESDECSDIKLRRDEKKVLKELNQSDIVRFPLREVTGKTKKLSVSKVIRTPAEKLYLVAQYILSDFIEPKITLLPSMRIEGDKIFYFGARILRAASEYYQSTLTFSAATNAFALSKALDIRKWPDSKMHISQLKHSRAKKVMEKLLAANITTLSAVEAADPRRIEMKVDKQFPFGNNLQGDVKDFPSALCIVMKHQLVGREYNVDVTVSFKNASNSGLTTMNHLPAKYPGTLFVGSEHDDRLLYVQRLPVREFSLDVSSDVHSTTIFHGQFNCEKAPTGEMPLCLCARVIFERCVGRDVEEYHDIERNGASPRTPVKSRSVTPNKSPASTPSMKQAKIVMDSTTKRFRLAKDDDEVRRKVSFEEYASTTAPPAQKSEDVCNRCGMKGHWARDCLFPDNRPEADRPRLADQKCHRCGNLGHLARDCTVLPEGACRTCGVIGHFARDCPGLDAALDKVEQAPSQRETSDSDDAVSWDFVFD